MIKSILIFGILLVFIVHGESRENIHDKPNTSTSIHPAMNFLHFWISGGELQALDILKQEFIKKGGKWHHVVTKDYQLMKMEASIRSSKGFPVSAMLLLGGMDIKNITKLNYIQPINKIIDYKAEDLLHPVALNASMNNKQMMGIPLSIHNENWAWHNLHIYKQLNLSLPKTWDEFFLQAPLIVQKGYAPIAVGQDAFSVRILFSVLLAGIGGKDTYNQFFLSSSREGLDSIKFQKTLSAFSKIREYAFTRKLNIWSDATKEVINNRAAMQIMGDWAKADFLAEGKIIGKDFQCKPAPSANKYFLAAVDVISFSYVKSNAERLGQKRFIDILLDNKIQTKFNIVKGATPAIRTFDIHKLDSCIQSRLPQLENSQNIIYSPRLLISEKKLFHLQKAIVDFWRDTNMSTTDLTRNLKEVLENSVSN